MPCFTLLILLLAATAWSADGRAVTPAPREGGVYPAWLERIYQRIEADLAQPEDLKRVTMLLIGDSITYGWRDQQELWQLHFRNPHRGVQALNLGVAGDRTEHLLYRWRSRSAGGMGHVDSPHLHPAVVMLMIGTNNLFVPEESPDETVEGIFTVVRAIEGRFPTATIILCSLLPVDPAHHPQPAIKVPRINALLAQRVAALGDGPLVWLDLQASMVGQDGQPQATLFADPVHLNAEGYRTWWRALEPVLTRILGPTTPR